jgi:KDO2-lipid IV(A) lauroyltransferase
MTLGKEASNTYAKEVFASMGITASDTIGAATIFQQAPDIFEYKDLTPIVDFTSRGKGVLVLTAHTGNWDMLGGALVRSNVNLFAVGRRANSPRMQGVLEHLRNAFGVKTIWRGDPKQKEEITKVLKSGHALGVLIDQDIKASGCSADFFGIPAFTPTGAVALAMRARAEIVLVFTYRDSDGRYRALTKIIEDRASPIKVAQQYNAFLEDAIRKHPAQWVWFHKRWRTDPAGNRRSSKEYLSFLKERCAASGHTLTKSAAALLVAAGLTLTSCRTILGLNGSRLLSRAEEYSRQGETDKAIEAYNDHIAERIEDEKRPEWENPYFYELIIGDLYLREGKVAEALLSYERAENNKVDLVLVSDRYRYVASWYEKSGDLLNAMEVLKKYRERDSLLFDAMLDRLAKELVASGLKTTPKTK